MKRVYAVEYAGHVVRYSFLCRRTWLYFRSYIRPAIGEEFDVCATPELMELGRKLLPEDSTDEYVEYRLLIELTALHLLRYDCCIFHSAAFVFRGRAWLLAAESGVGKTTQFLNWQRLHPGEIEMISGDMPVIEARADGSVFVHSTSWCGKECIGTKGLSAPLGGVVLLEQENENTVAPIGPADAIFPFFAQFMVRPENEEQILALSHLIERMLENAKLFKFTNLGDDSSTEMLRAFIIGEHEGGCNG